LIFSAIFLFTSHTDVLIEESGANTIALKDGMARAKGKWEAMETHAHQDRQFGQMEDAISILEKDDDFVPIFFLQPQAPASRTLAVKQRQEMTVDAHYLCRCSAWTNMRG